jgi:thymidylate kinase
MNHYRRSTTAQRSYHHTDKSVKLDSLLEEGITYVPSTLDLVHRLCQALREERITYCHWKSNNALDRSASGENDLDLLVSRADIERFTELLYRLGLKQAEAASEKQMPGVLDYFGYDKEADRLIHLHAHYQLVLGHDMTKNYRLPIERPYLESAAQGSLFKVPAPEFEFIVFVIRMVLKHSTWDVILGREGGLKLAERQELAHLRARVDKDRLDDILRQHLPYISVALFDNCVQALQPACSTWRRIKTGQQLQARLRANARRPSPIDVYLKLRRRAISAIRRRIVKTAPKYRLASGGAMIALVGGDGAGKSTAVDALTDWLSKHFHTTRVHMGKPAWSRTTNVIRGILKIGNVLGLYPVETSMRETLEQESLVSPGYPWLLRQVCTARDRYGIYVKARRFAAKGGLVIVDRFPLPQIQRMDGPRTGRFVRELMDGPQAERLMSPRQGNRLTETLVKLEESYYQQVSSPELLIVLRLDPEIAVRRKTDEDADFVRERSTEIWELNWEDTDAHVIDSSQSKADVLTQLKALIWAEL